MCLLIYFSFFFLTFLTNNAVFIVEFIERLFSIMVDVLLVRKVVTVTSFFK
jgi:hypothetical protein